MKIDVCMLIMVFLLQTIITHASEEQNIQGLGLIENVRGVELIENTKNWFCARACKEYLFRCENFTYDNVEKFLNRCEVLIVDKIHQEEDGIKYSFGGGGLKLDCINNTQTPLDFEYINGYKSPFYRIIQRDEDICNEPFFFYIQFPIDIREDNKKRSTLLHNASFSLKDKLASLLLFLGANPNDQNDCGETALHIIMRRPSRYFKKQKKIITLLLDQGALLDIVNKKRETPIHLLCEQQNKKLLEWVLTYTVIDQETKRKKIYFSLDEICCYSDDIFEVLQRYDMVNVFEDTNNQCIFKVVEKGQLKLLLYLLENDYDCNITNIFGQHLLHVACQEGRYEVFKILFENLVVNRNDFLFIKKKLLIFMILVNIENNLF